jgi:2-polyprenyl-3-methyl-5-hydroxy-6-metoxy-1,4-benzoquinol methylase
MYTPIKGYVSERSSPRAHEIHSREREYFDGQARMAKVFCLDHRTLQRYSKPGSLFARDHMFRIVRDLSGKTLLDVGCGLGQDALMLAKLGASVTGVDLSSEAISVAKRRLAAHGCAGEFIIAPFESAAVGQYDVVWVKALLHHVLHDLDSILAKLKACVASGGVIVMAEPVALSRWLRDCRLIFGPADGTPDERPLEKGDLDAIHRHFPGAQIRYFRVVGRVGKFLAPCVLETAPWWQRAVLQGLAIADSMLVSVPLFRRYASIAVMVWRNR